MKIALLGTRFGQVHAAVFAARSDVDEVIVFGRTPEKLATISDQYGFATTTDLDGLITSSDVDLVDICLPTPLHADVAVRAMDAGKDVLVELPMATTMDDARRIVDLQEATGRQAFVDMFSRFIAANRYLRDAVGDGRYGALECLEVEGRTALLWEGYDLALESLALDMMHSDFDLVTSVLGRPSSVDAVGWQRAEGRGSVARVQLRYPEALAVCAASALMPKPYGVRGGYRATFSHAVLERSMIAGWEGQGPSTLVEYTAGGERVITLPETAPYEEMIDHVLACLAGRAENLVPPSSALVALEVTLEVHRLLGAAQT